MANTQTTVPTFISGQVLEAEQLNNSARTGVPVFATTVTRDAGFGGAGEKTLAEGQLCYLESTNVVQYYDGAAWATLGPAPAVSSALTYVGGGALSGASITFSNVFSATYDNYLVIIANAIGTGSPTIKATLGAITTGYIAGSAVNGGAFGYSASQAFWDFGYCGDGSDYVVTQMTLVNPFLTQKKIAFGNNIYSTNLYYQLTGTNSSTTSCTSLTLTTSANTFTAGNARIYGYSNS
jgi:voltage-gated potassium channel Kch